MGGLDLHQCGCLVPNILGRGGQIFEISSPDFVVLIIRLALRSRTRYWISSNIRSTIFTCIYHLKCCSENAQRPRTNVTLSVTHCRTWRRKYALYGFTFSSSLLSQTTSTFFKQRRTLKKKIAAKLKSIFCSIRYSKPSTFFEGSCSFWFGNSRFKICDE